MTRRDFVSGLTASASLVAAACSPNRDQEGASTGAKASVRADVTLHISPVLADIAKDHTISTIGYNGAVPGPLIRLKEGVPVTVDLFNDTDTTELVHWHGQVIPADVD